MRIPIAGDPKRMVEKIFSARAAETFCSTDRPIDGGMTWRFESRTCLPSRRSLPVLLSACAGALLRRGFGQSGLYLQSQPDWPCRLQGPAHPSSVGHPRRPRETPALWFRQELSRFPHFASPGSTIRANAPDAAPAGFEVVRCPTLLTCPLSGLPDRDQSIADTNMVMQTHVKHHTAEG